MATDTTLTTLPASAQSVVAPLPETTEPDSAFTLKTLGSYMLVGLMTIKLAMSINGGLSYILAVLAMFAAIYTATNAGPVRTRVNTYLTAGATFAAVVFLLFGVVSTFSGGATKAVASVPVATGSSTLAPLVMYGPEIVSHRQTDCLVLRDVGRTDQYNNCMRLPTPPNKN